jgi:hypothetical protein
VWDDLVTLRNFGLSFPRRNTRPNAGISWRPWHAGIGFVLVLMLVLVLILIAMLAP